MFEKEDAMCVQLCAPVDEDLTVLDLSNSWGLRVFNNHNGDSAYVPCGNKSVIKEFMKRYKSILYLVFETIRNSDDEIAVCMLDDVMDNESSIIINDERYSHRRILKELKKFNYEE
jgi:hypothetical protein